MFKVDCTSFGWSHLHGDGCHTSWNKFSFAVVQKPGTNHLIPSIHCPQSWVDSC